MPVAPSQSDRPADYIFVTYSMLTRRVRVDLGGDLRRTIAQDFSLTHVDVDSIRMFDSDGFGSTEIYMDELLRRIVHSENRTGISVYARCSNVIYVEYQSKIYEIYLNELRMLIQYCDKIPAIREVPLHVLAFSIVTETGGEQELHEKPDFKDDTVSGFSVKHPLRLTRTDMIEVKLEQSNIDVIFRKGDCYGVAAEAACTVYKAASCREQIALLHLESDEPIDQTSKIPDWSLGFNRGVRGKMIRRKLSLLTKTENTDDETETVVTEMTFESDIDITSRCEGLVEASIGNGHVIRKLHSLKDGGVYVMKPHHSEHFHRWEIVDGKVREKEAALAVEAYFNTGSNLRAIHNKIKDKHGRKAQEWDAVFFDDDTGQLFLVEVKHKVRISDVHAVMGKFSLIHALLAETASEAYKTLRVTNITLVIAGAIFEPTAATTALDHNILLCYPNGSRYSVHSVTEARDDLIKERFTA
jgi:hypothetical protein